jgi:hypothetical protein
MPRRTDPGRDRSFRQLPGALFAVGLSIFTLVSDYADSRTLVKVGLVGTVIASLAVVVDLYRQYRTGKLLKAEIEDNAARITRWLVENGAEFAQSGISECRLACALKISTEGAVTAIDRLETREAVVRDPVALTDPPRFLVKPGRHWTPTRPPSSGLTSGT